PQSGSFRSVQDIRGGSEGGSHREKRATIRPQADSAEVQWLVHRVLSSGPPRRRAPRRTFMGEWPEEIDIPEQVFVNDNADASEIAARDEFNRNNPPIRGLVVPDDLRTIELVKRPWRNNK